VTDYDQQLASIGIRAPDTCEWLSQNPTFSHWLHSTKSELLWLRGLPGVGKTVLTKHLIMSVIPSEWVLSSIYGQVKKSEGQQNAPFLAYFFCSERDREQQLEENILFSMLHQLIIGEPETIESLLSFKETGRRRLFTFLSDNSQLWAAVKSVLVASKRETIFLVLDALDEMEPQIMLTFATRLRNMIDAIAPRIEPRSVKLLLTSRPKPELDEILCCPSISIRNERDVRHYVETRADYLVDAFGISASLRAEVVGNICEKAGSMFLWARLAWDQFCQGLTDAASVRRNLQKVNRLPPSLHSLYEELLNRHDDADLTILRNIFAWLTTSSRPLTVREMRFAISLKNSKSLAEAHKNMLGEARLSSIAPSLISVDAAHHVQFTHQSVKDFLLSSETLPRYQLRLDEVHANVATSCLRCFTLPDFNAEEIRQRLCSRESRDSTAMHDVSEECELLLYATTNWPYHAKIAGRNHNIWQAFQDLSKATESMRLWAMLYLYDGSLKCQQVWYEQRNFSEIPPPLHIAVYLGNRYLMEKLLASRVDINQVYERSRPDGDFTLKIPAGTVLHFPDLDAQTVAFLIENGADPIVKNSAAGYNALLQAIRDRNERLSTALLASGDGRFLRSSGTKSSNSILLAAMDAQMESVVTAILNDPQVDPCGPAELRYETTTSGDYFTGPLEHACLFGMESMARLLFAHPRVIEAQKRKDEEYPGVNPTSLAFITLLQGWEDLTLQAIQRFPSDLGSDLDKDRRTLLHHAVIEQWHEVLEACLARMPKSKLNMMDKNGMTALHYAASTRNWYAAKRCIEAGVQPQLEDNHGRTPAHVAAEAGSERVLNYILEKDPTVVSEVDHKRRTVLHYVATWNLVDIAETLVSQAGASVAIKDCDGRTAAHLAAMFGSSAVLALVLGTGFIGANARDAYGNSLLHCAVESRTTSCIEVLLWREDIHLNALNCHGKSPLDVTFSYKDDELAAQIRELLESAGCTKGLWRPPRRSYAYTASVSEVSGGVEYDLEKLQLAIRTARPETPPPPPRRRRRPDV
jgi:ankyrin repeat protein